MLNNDKYTINNDECAYFHFVCGLFNEKAGASYLTVINSSRDIAGISFIFSCEKRNNSPQVQLNSHDQKDIMRLAKRSQEKSVGQIILQRHSHRVLVLRTLHQECQCPYHCQHVKSLQPEARLFE